MFSMKNILECLLKKKKKLPNTTKYFKNKMFFYLTVFPLPFHIILHKRKVWKEAIELVRKEK